VEESSGSAPTDLTAVHESPRDQRSTLELVRSIAIDTSTLVRKEVELAKHELVEAVMARLQAAGAMAAAGVMGVFMLLFLALGAAAALALVVPAWAAALIVAGGFALLAAPAVLFGLRKLRKPPLVPEQTKRTVKEDVEWAKQQLKR